MGEERENPVALPVPLSVHDRDMARMERVNKWLAILLAVCIVLLVLSNAYWIHNMMQYDFSSYQIDAQQDGRGINIVGGGNVAYGTESADSGTYTYP